MTKKNLWLAATLALLIAAALVVTHRSAARASETHPPPAAPDESATIADDPTLAPDAAQSADHGVSFPADI
jgi:hypothetical protein